ncbi:hypothetical protein PVK06_007974 [Gossypium arboreum]|uniref:UBN2 domain-containing protein n=1 Tax=Gossypium arboreum TaxID=29729 RepID=A0ABR0QIS1_GOSAR|nr:hypothetical protein PVK06_007974 [Gossypium arboreum]
MHYDLMSIIVSQCQSAKEILDNLATTHEGISQVKESMTCLLTFDYDLFKMKSEENIKDMSNRFTNIINLKAIGKAYSNKEMVKKLLNSLPNEWEAYVTIF